MKRLLYISTARGVMTPADRDRLLAVSRRNNAAVGVTGLLIVGHRRFLQALEGPADAVDATYARIHADPRHHAAVVLADQPIDTRSFGKWAMGFQPGVRIAPSGEIAHDVAALASVIADPTLRSYFTGFAATQAAA